MRLVAYWRFENGMRTLYDMRENWIGTEQSAIDAAIRTIAALPEPSDADYKADLKTALQRFREVPESERKYARNYSFLTDTVALVGESGSWIQIHRISRKSALLKIQTSCVILKERPLTALVSNFYFGQGPWTPFQMFAWGFIGFIAGLSQAR